MVGRRLIASRKPHSTAVTSQLALRCEICREFRCPVGTHGYGRKGATRSVEEGADTIVCLLPVRPKAGLENFLRDRKEIPW